MEQKVIERAAEFISANGFESVLALIDFDGYPTASTLTLSKNDGIKSVTFCTLLDSVKVKRIRACNRASVCFSSPAPECNITLVGKIEVLTDPKIKKEMWYDGLENHFSGPEDENYCVLKFVTERYKFFIDYKEVEGKI
jgi:general stress protein 26